MMSGKIDMPSLIAKRSEIGDRRFGAGDDDEIGALRQRRAGLDNIE